MKLDIKKQTFQLNIASRYKQRILSRKIPNGREIPKEMFNSLSYQGIKNQNYFVITVPDIIFILEVC